MPLFISNISHVYLQGLHFRVPRVNPYDLDDIPTEYRAMLATNYPPRREDDIDGWFDYFQREVSMYKQAIRRIIQDVAQLRSQHKTLTEANADLRTKIENFDKKKKVLYEIFEGDKLDKNKIQDIFSERIVGLVSEGAALIVEFLDRLNARISSQALELKENHVKIANYEKELARVSPIGSFRHVYRTFQRSELRAQYDALVRNHDAREIEMKLIKDRLKDAHGLEETVRRQELTIERMEAMISNYVKEKRSRGKDLPSIHHRSTESLFSRGIERYGSIFIIGTSDTRPRKTSDQSNVLFLMLIHLKRWFLAAGGLKHVRNVCQQ